MIIDSVIVVDIVTTSLPYWSRKVKMFLLRSLLTVKSSSRVLPMIVATNCKSGFRFLAFQKTRLKYSTTSQEPDAPTQVSSPNRNTTDNHNKIHIRLATEDDYRDVVRVSEGIYEGDDYLCPRFHEWLKTPNKLILLAEFEEKVIGLIVANIVSGGKTLLFQSNRIHQDYRGRGFSYPLLLGATDYVRQMYPQVTKMQGMISKTISAGSTSRIAINVGGKVIMKQKSYFFKVKDGANFPEELFHRYKTTVKERGVFLYKYAVKDAQSIITSYPTVLDSIAPQKVMIRGFQPYEALPCNIDYIFIENDKMFAEVNVEDLKGGKIPMSFSHGSKFPRAHTVLWMCVIYANDQDSFRAHFLKQIKSAHEMIAKDFTMWVNVCSKSASLPIEAKKVLDEELMSLQPGTTAERDMMYLAEQVFDN